MIWYPDDIYHPDEVFDPGAQQERTGLAWQRTGLAFTVAAGLYVHAAITPTRPWLLFPGAAMLLLGGITLLWGWRRYERLHHVLRTGTPVAAPTLLATLATAVTTFSLSALTLTLLTR